MGCAMTGNTTETVYDDVSGYDPPLPSYQIKFQVPDQLPVLFSVSIANTALVASMAAMSAALEEARRPAYLNELAG